MRRVLVTGAQGFVGRYLVAQLLEAEPEVRVLGVGRSAERPGAFSHGGRMPLELRRVFAEHGERYAYVPAPLEDARGLGGLLDAHAPDCVFHLASALHTAPEAELIRTNLEGTRSLLSVLEGRDTLLVHGSSASVYGEPRELPIAEDHLCAPVGPYGVSKRAAEQLLAKRASGGRLRHVVARIFNIVGPGQTSDHVCGRLAQSLVVIERGAAPELEVGPLDPTRDFVDVRDVARALIVLARQGLSGETFNVASGQETSIREVLQFLLRLSGAAARVREGKPHPSGVSRQVAKISRLARLGYAPRISLEQSLGELLDHQRALAAPAELTPVSSPARG